MYFMFVSCFFLYCSVLVLQFLSSCSKVALHEKCPNTEFFLVQMQENTDQKKLHISTLLAQCRDF